MMCHSTRSVVVGLTIVGAMTLLATQVTTVASELPGRAGTPDSVFSALPQSLTPTTDPSTGAFESAAMGVEVVLAPRNVSRLSALMADVYNPNSPNYSHWLKKGQFFSVFAPSSAQIAAVTQYLRASGLVVGHSSSPFLLRASGSSSAVSAAFRTSLRTYRNSRGEAYFSNASAVRLPTSIAASVLGVVGLSNTVRTHPRPKHPFHLASAVAHSKGSCETPYPTRARIFASFNNNTPLSLGYGAGPGCNGMTPSQINSIYGAQDFGPRGKGAGVNLAVFELSAYQHSDIDTWTHSFYGSAYRPPLIDIIVDGGPLSPICPSGDTCPPNINGYSGDVEVDGDIEMQLAISPKASHILVYNAPNDYSGQTLLDEYAQIAYDDLADVVSSSWGACENDAGAGYVQAENVIFEQMALQGQSMFAGAGDSGAFDCIADGGTTIVNALDPAAQPWVTSVGGTSFESFNPGLNPRPAYPKGVETVWNIDGLCNSSSNEGGHPGLFWCALTGAGGGGDSQFWGRPFYQFGPDIINPYTTYGNGTTHCSLVAVGMPCREVPDISADADSFTPYADFCTGNAATPYSACATFSGADTPPGWIGGAGTSLASPLWSAIFADRDSYNGIRSGNANPLLYLLYNIDPQGYFNDITGIGQATNNNGLFPTRPGYDLATGIGTPKMSAIITGFPRR